MDISRFAASPIGALVAVSVDDQGQRYDHQAFVPNDLPDSVDLSPNAIALLETASIELGRLDGPATRLPDPALLVRPTIRREAVSTSALEGTYAALTDVFNAEALTDDGDPATPESVGEVLNFVRTAEVGLDLIARQRLTVSALRSLHQLLMEGLEHEDSAGAFKEKQNWIGPANCTIEESYFVPMPPGPDLEEKMRRWADWNYAEDTIPLLVRLAISHYQFETIHPFMDGNGRLGRLAILLLLVGRQALTTPLIAVSPFFEENREDYVAHLREVSASGDYDPWIRFFLTALATQAARAREKAERLLSVQEELVAQVRDQNWRGAKVQIAESLIGEPVTTVPRLAERLGVSPQAVYAAVEQLQEIEVLMPVDDAVYNRRYFSPSVIEILLS